MPTVVVNMRDLKPEFIKQLNRRRRYQRHVLIDRSTKWGNPFKVGPGGGQPNTNEEAVRLYRKRLRRLVRQGEITLEELAGLQGKTLVCWCQPLPCHGDVLAEAAEWARNELRRKE